MQLIYTKVSSSKAYSTSLQGTRSNLLVASLAFLVDSKEEHEQEHKQEHKQKNRHIVQIQQDMCNGPSLPLTKRYSNPYIITLATVKSSEAVG